MIDKAISLMTHQRIMGRAAWICAAAGFLLSASPAPAHSFLMTEALVIIKNDSTCQIDLTLDCDAFALGLPTITDDELVYRMLAGLPQENFDKVVEDARRSLMTRLHVRFDGQEQRLHVEFPQHGTPLSEGVRPPSVLGTTARLSGRVPDGAGRFTFGVSRAFDAVLLTIFDQPSGRTTRWLLGPGEECPPFELGAPLESSPIAAADWRTVAGRYLILGFEHIIPAGLDHILFVLGLFLLSTRAAPLLWQITAFTVAHTITLGWSMIGGVELPSRPVETLIALSIAYVAVENIVTSRLHVWRPMLVFGFGLMHGLGFAGVLRELGLPRDQLAVSLVAFNVGVELGQLAVVLAALALVGWYRNKPWYRKVIVVPASAAIAVVGLWWAVERAMA